MAELSYNEKRVLKLIPRGRERPRPARELSSLLQLDYRSIKEIVSRLVTRHRIPIIGDRGANGGYYIPETEDERREGLRALKSQTIEQQERLNVATYCSLTEWESLLESEDDHGNL